MRIKSNYAGMYLLQALFAWNAQVAIQGFSAYAKFPRQNGLSFAGRNTVSEYVQLRRTENATSAFILARCLSDRDPLPLALEYERALELGYCPQ